MAPQLPSFDLVVATVDRTDEVRAFLDSIERQRYPAVRVLLVDQNGDDRLADVLHGRDLEILRLSSARGLSRARNSALQELQADLVSFPDDDCVYPPGLLGRVAERFAGDPALDGLTGRSEDASGHSSRSWKRDAATLTDDNLWNRAISFTIFLRRSLVEQVGAFDEHLGLGSREPWSSGEEIDYLIRAVRSGARIRYDPGLVIRHELRADDARTGRRDGASIGYLLRKHNYPMSMVTRMLVRPAGGTVVSLTRLDRATARYRLATLQGRIRGYLGASATKISQ